MPTTPNLSTLSADALAAELARREEEAQRQQAAADAAWTIELASRARVILDGWKATDQELIAAGAEAEREFREAALADPMVAAYVRVRWHRYRRANLRNEAQAAANVLDQPETAARITYLNDWGTRLIEDLTALADSEASRLASEASAAVLARLNKPEDL